LPEYTHAAPRTTKNRIRGLENAVLRLAEEIRNGKSTQEDNDDFVQMVKSHQFQAEVEETLQLYREDPSQFSDPFEEFRKYQHNVRN